MNTDDLREQFFKEHPNSKMDKCIMHEDVGYDYFTDDYVLWLEKKLMLYNVVGRSEQFYCFNKQNKKLDRCLKQCSTCESMKLMQ